MTVDYVLWDNMKVMPAIGGLSTRTHLFDNGFLIYVTKTTQGIYIGDATRDGKDFDSIETRQLFNLNLWLREIAEHDTPLEGKLDERPER